ncbi:hypothetical protein ACEPAG_2365 [Sanghuangporus baumii]
MAAPFTTNGLRALRISRAMHRICRPRLAVCSSSVLVRQLSTSLPRFTSVATATDTVTTTQPVSSHATDASQPVPPSEVVAEEPAKEEPKSFSSLIGKVSKETLEAITVRPMRHTHMTTVQEAVLSMLPELIDPLKKRDDGSFEEPSGPRDLMVRAKTGTGKTLAFLVPAIESRVKAIEEAASKAKALAGKAADRRLVLDATRNFVKSHVGALILSPTRELAKQIAVEAERLSTHHGFKIHQFLGGESKGQQLREWKYNRRDIVVATTGRLRDLMDSQPELLKPIKEAKLLILDEADTMLDIGFRPDIEYITAQLPRAPERQTFIFSATISKAVQQIARQTLSKNHVYINTVLGTDSPVHAHIPQYHTVLSSAKDQLPHVLRLLAHDQLTNPGRSKVMIFLPTTKLTQLYSTLVRELARAVLPAGRNTVVYELHSKRSMESRTRTSDKFRHDESGACVLITSDVSARGVDYPGVTRVIQLGIPATSDQYVHRIGRTGRQGSTQGRADLVLLPWEHGFIRDQLSGIPLKPVTSHDFEKHVHEIAEKHDSDPELFLEPHKSSLSDRRRRHRDALFTGRVAERLKGVNEEIDEVLSSAVEEEDIHDTFASLLGYYVSKNDELRTSRDTILEGLREWAVHAGGLSEPPHVSETFLNKIGFPSERAGNRMAQRSGGRSFDGHRDKYRVAPNQNRWSGRGSKQAKMRRSENEGGDDGYSSRRPRGRDSGYSYPERRERDGGSYRNRDHDSDRRRPKDGDEYDGERRGRRSSWPN